MTEDRLEPIEAAFKALADMIANRMSRPLYLRIEMQDGQLEISQIEYLSVEEFAAMVKTQTRTVYGWIDRGLLAFCKPVGTGQNLIPLRTALHWIEASAVVKEKKAAQG
jgi:excisionase family DNA binding protein